MATVKPNTNKDGEIISYRWRAYIKDDLEGNKRVARTVPAPKNMTPVKALKQMQHEADQWEKDIRAGIVPVDTQSFAHFINEEWWKAYVLDGAHKDASIGFYKQLTTRIISRLGNRNLNEIKSTDLQAFINWLRTDARQENTGSAARFFLKRLGVKTPDEITDTVAFTEKAKAAKAKGQPWYLKFARWHKKPLDTVTPDDLRRYVAKLQAEDTKPTDKPLSAATVKHYYKTLAVIFNYAERHNRIEHNPMRKVNPPKLEHHDVDFLAPEQAQAFIKALNDTPIRWRAFMNLLVGTGLRRGEAVGIQWQDVDLKAATITISRNVTFSRGKIIVDTPKSSRSNRTLPIVPSLVALLREWQSEQLTEWQGLTVNKKVTSMLAPKAYVFGSETDPYAPMFPHTPTRWLKSFIKKHHLPDVSPHDLRHTAGSLMLASGATIKDVQDTLGHADPSTTLKFYAGTTPESLRKAADGLAALLEG